MDVTDLDNAKFTWVWNSRTQGPVTAFRIKVGVTSGVYDTPNTITDVSLRECPMRQLIEAPGSYVATYCGVNTAGEGPNADEIQINVIMVPPKPVAPLGVTQE